MITYKSTPKKNPKTAQVAYYAQMAATSPVELSQVCSFISERSTISEPDVVVILRALETVIVDNVSNGHSVRLGDLGSFRPTIKSSGAATEVEARKKAKSLITKVPLRFSKSSVMLKKLSKEALSFRKV